MKNSNKSTLHLPGTKAKPSHLSIRLPGKEYTFTA